MLEKISPELRSYQSQKLALYEKENHKAKPGGIVFTGDSIIEFFPLKKHLGRDDRLINRGIAGTDTSWLLRHIDRQVCSLSPRQLFILIGTNDLGQGFEHSVILERLSELVAKIRRASFAPTIYLISVLPVNEEVAYQDRVKVRRNAQIKALNQELMDMTGVVFIDLYPSLLDEKGNLAASYTTDGLHLSQAGYAQIAQQLKAYLN